MHQGITALATFAPISHPPRPNFKHAAAYIASHVHNIKIALLAPQSNPVLLAEEMAMLATMAEGRLIVGMLRDTTNEMMTYDLNPRNRASAPPRPWS
jgi:alkanesulfonate monooxygenase SsuD/methylene tetrahydromethanopterin reductase-like flavin-dependent oxidoreductase (luciferase family)